MRRQDPQRAQILAGLRQRLLELPADETAVFQDEVDINLALAWLTDRKSFKVQDEAYLPTNVEGQSRAA